jgi:hypothetical protein
LKHRDEENKRPMKSVHSTGDHFVGKIQNDNKVSKAELEGVISDNNHLVRIRTKA